MRNLLLLFLKYGGIFVFIFLEVVCFYLIVQFNESQQEIYFNSLNRVNLYFEEQTSELSSFFYLQEINDSLALENARLRAELPNLMYNPYAIIDTSQQVEDSLLVQYEFIPVNIVNNSHQKKRNYFVIDKGSNHGITPHMGVLSTNGVAGVVISVEPHYSLAMSLLNTQIRVSCEVYPSGYHGNLWWEGKDPMVMKLDNIPKHAIISNQDTVQTSGYSNMFPPNIKIGTVKEVSIPGGNNYYEIDVALFSDLTKVKTAYVVKHHWIEELNKLQKEALDE